MDWEHVRECATLKGSGSRDNDSLGAKLLLRRQIPPKSPVAIKLRHLAGWTAPADRGGARAADQKSTCRSLRRLAQYSRLVENAALGLAGIVGLAAQLDAAPDIEVDRRLARSRLVALLDGDIGAVVEILAGRDRGAALVVGGDVEIVDADRAAQVFEQRRRAADAGELRRRPRPAARSAAATGSTSIGRRSVAPAPRPPAAPAPRRR